MTRRRSPSWRVEEEPPDHGCTIADLKLLMTAEDRRLIVLLGSRNHERVVLKAAGLGLTVDELDFGAVDEVGARARSEPFLDAITTRESER